MTCQRQKTLIPCAMLGGNTALVARLTGALVQVGYCLDPHANLAVVLDIPRGHALQRLEERQQRTSYLVITGNTCPAYLADLWGGEYRAS